MPAVPGSCFTVITRQRKPRDRSPLKQVMTLKTFVAHLRRLPAGHNVSYGRRWKTEQETTIAVLPIGYADGIRRHLTGRLQVMIGGRRYPVVGTITMDQIMVDVGDDPA
jgi:alanine racemase